MSDTIIFEGYAKLSTSTVSEQILIDARQAMASDDFEHRKVTLSVSESLTITGGIKSTLISTNLSNEDTICININGALYELGSLLILPGNIGSLVITNNDSVVVNVEMVFVN